MTDLKVAEGSLIELTSRLGEGDDLDAILRRIVATARDLGGACCAAIEVSDPMGDGTDRFVTEGRDSGGAPAPSCLSPHTRPVQGMVDVPIDIRGETVGSLRVARRRDGLPFSARERDHLRALAGCAAITIEHAGRLEMLKAGKAALEQTVDALRATTEMARALAGETHLDAVLELVARRALTRLRARTVVMLLAEGSRLRIAAVAGEQPPRLRRDDQLPSGSVAEEVLRSGRPLHLDRDAIRARSDAQGLADLAHDAQDGLFAPLSFRGRRLGVLVALDRRGGHPAETDEELLSAFTVTAAAGVATAQSVSTERLMAREAAAEEERRRWARELHDETLQNLAALRLRLTEARRAPDGELRRMLEQVAAGLQEEVTHLREIIQDVRPSSLDDLGLEAALEALVVRHAGERGPALRLDIDLDHESGHAATRLEPEVEIGLYRIAQEALTNAIKHARARHVHVAVAEIEGEVGVRVRDDGAGFDPRAASDGVGLVGIRERVELLGGRLAIHTLPGAGTTLEARLPAQHRPAPAAGGG
jgi:signal transduction histidine kinase